MPILTIIAGPNGSGKSTATRHVYIEGRERLLDPDAVARDLMPSDPAAAAISAGRAVLRRIEQYLSHQVSFAVETTLSSRNNVELMRRARLCAYHVRLIFVALDSPERNIQRVRDRVAKGGHFVPDEDVRRRYARSMANLKSALEVADETEVYDNSVNGHELVLMARAGQIVWCADNLPHWVNL